MVTPTNHVIAWPGFILGEALALWRFLQLFLPDIGEYQKMSHHLSSQPAPGTVPYYGKSGPSYCITSIKRLDEGLR